VARLTSSRRPRHGLMPFTVALHRVEECQLAPDSRDHLGVAVGEAGGEFLLERSAPLGCGAGAEAVGFCLLEADVPAPAHAAGLAGPSAAGLLRAALIASDTVSRSDRSTPCTAATCARSDRSIASS